MQQKQLKNQILTQENRPEASKERSFSGSAYVSSSSHHSAKESSSVENFIYEDEKVDTMAHTK